MKGWIWRLLNRTLYFEPINCIFLQVICSLICILLNYFTLWNSMEYFQIIAHNNITHENTWLYNGMVKNMHLLWFTLDKHLLFERMISDNKMVTTKLAFTIILEKKTAQLPDIIAAEVRLAWPPAPLQLSVQKVTAWIFESSAVAPLKINKTTHKSPSYRGIKPRKSRRRHSPPMSPSRAPINSQVSPRKYSATQLWLRSKLYDTYGSTTALGFAC